MAKTPNMVFEAFVFAKKRYFSYLMSVIPRILIWLVIGCVAIVPFLFASMPFVSMGKRAVNIFFMFTAYPLIIIISCVIAVVRAQVFLATAREEKLPMFILPRFWTVLNVQIGKLLKYTAVFLGTLCFLVPGVILWGRLCVTSFLIVDGMGPVAALKKSNTMTRSIGHGPIYLGALFFVVIAILGLASFIVPRIFIFEIGVLFISFLELVVARFYVLLGQAYSE